MKTCLLCTFGCRRRGLGKCLIRPISEMKKYSHEFDEQLQKYSLVKCLEFIKRSAVSYLVDGYGIKWSKTKASAYAIVLRCIVVAYSQMTQ
ncbi:hypothetical protein KIN20_025712 [Parelaphostrongylus tenuis]|uniref:Uncharacterized protein n=1 Tax=Parelaphostrongylus tenuis TaxID=148309 RepID=A0AAD5N951_PARTN|nr:hypothetical protein KIN20_025712 [Parelaphostrongylus tenuis]